MTNDEIPAHVCARIAEDVASRFPQWADSLSSAMVYGVLTNDWTYTPISVREAIRAEARGYGLMLMADRIIVKSYYSKAFGKQFAAIPFTVLSEKGLEDHEHIYAELDGLSPSRVDVVLFDDKEEAHRYAKNVNRKKGSMMDHEDEIAEVIDNLADDTEEKAMREAKRLGIEADEIIDRIANELKARIS